MLYFQHESVFFQLLQNELREKETEIDSLKILGTSLIDLEQGSPVNASGLSQNVEQMNNSWAKLDHEVRPPGIREGIQDFKHLSLTHRIFC